GMVVALTVLGLLVLCAIFAGAIAPYRAAAQDLTNTLAGPSSDHLLGTDHLGRDVFSRLLWGTRPALLGLLVAVSVAVAVGLPWGMIAGYFGGLVDTLLMR